VVGLATTVSEDATTSPGLSPCAAPLISAMASSPTPPTAEVVGAVLDGEQPLRLWRSYIRGVGCLATQSKSRIPL
jgi:hypothetical protein